MSSGFWTTIEKPIYALAPMADVTDAAFRRIIATYGKPDVMWTEFVSADGLFLGGKEALMRDLIYTEEERPIVAQFFSPDPERMKQAGALAVEFGFDGIDLNMGCPDKSICKQGAGAAMIRDPEGAQRVIRATKEGVAAAGGDIPVSVKTRTGYSKDELETWIPALLETEPAVLTLHARTKKEMSKVPARWDTIARAVEIRDEMKSKTLILGNGDVADLDDAEQKVSESGADGAMLGRAIFGNPWLFNRGYESSTEERLRVMVEHTYLFEELLGEYKSFALMKKHYKAYVNGWPGAKELRMKLMEAEDAKEVERIVDVYFG